MEKLRILAWSSGIFLITASVWAAFQYGNPTAFLFSGLIGVLIPGIPSLLIQLKSRLAHGKRRLGIGNERSGEIYVSSSSVDDPVEKLTTIMERIKDIDGVKVAEKEYFNEGLGLVVTHSASHKTFIRFTDQNQIAITGATGHTPPLVNAVKESLSVSFTERVDSPFRKPTPVKGGLRVLLGVFLIALLIIGTMSLVGSAYPSDDYNTGEKAVLALIDARADLNPGMTQTDAKIAKANFIVDAISEEAVEIRWERPGSNRIMTHAEQVVGMGSDVRELLASARKASPTAEQQARIEQISADLIKAEGEVAVAINETLNKSRSNVSSDQLVAIRNQLDQQ